MQNLLGERDLLSVAKAQDDLTIENQILTLTAESSTKSPELISPASYQRTIQIFTFELHQPYAHQD